MQRVSDVVPVVDWAGHPIRHRIGNVQLNHVLILIGAGVLVFNIVAAYVVIHIDDDYILLTHVV